MNALPNCRADTDIRHKHATQMDPPRTLDYLLPGIDKYTSEAPRLASAMFVYEYPPPCRQFEKPVSGAVAPIIEKWRLQHPEMGLTKLSPGLVAGFSAQVI